MPNDDELAPIDDFVVDFPSGVVNGSGFDRWAWSTEA